MVDLDDGGPESEVDTLIIAYHEARRTVDSQIHLLDEIDSKAARLLRLNLILIGIILTGISVATAPQSRDGLSAASELLNSYVALGLVALLGSTVLAGLTYTASHLRTGMSGPDLLDMLWNDYSDRENLAGLVQSYARWIEQNYLTNALNAPLSTLTILLQIYAVTSFALGVIESVHGAVPGYAILAALLVLSVITYLAGLSGQVRRYIRERRTIT